MAEYKEKYKRSNSVCNDILNEEGGKHCISCETKIIEEEPTCPKPRPIVPGKVENYVQDDHYVHTDNNFTDEYKEKIDDLVDNAQSDWEDTDPESLSYIKNKPVIPDDVWEKGTGEHSVQTKDTGCEAKCDYSVAEGHNSKVVKDDIDPLSGQAAHAEGSGSIAKGYASHAEGGMTMALKSYSHSEGYYTTTGGDCSHAEGNHTITNNFGEHAEGRYNVSHKNSDDTGDPLNTQHSIGIGFFSPSFEFENSKNAVEVMQNGDAYFIGIGDYDGKNLEGAKTLQEVVNDKPLPYPALKKINEFAYDIYCDYLDYEYAIKYYQEEHQSDYIGSCSSVHKDYYYGRNFDWIYNDDVEFVVETPRKLGRHASVCVCGHVPGITKETIENGEYSEYYKIIPFKVVDGINDAGVCTNTNVVPIEGEISQHGTTVPYIETRHTLCSRMLPRFILDNFSNAKEAAEYIRDYVAVFDDPSLVIPHHYGLHVMVADKTRTFIIEFINIDGTWRNNLIENGVYVMTNFQLSNVSFNDDESVYSPEDHFSDETKDPVSASKVTPHGSGLERYNIANSLVDSIASESDMRELMDRLTYTNAYKDREGEPVWYSEFVGNNEEYGIDLRLDSSEELFNSVYEYAKEVFERRSRETGETWQTVHSCVYNLNDASVSIIFQEGAEGFEEEHKFVVGELWVEGTGLNSINSKGNFLSGGTSKGDYSHSEGRNNTAQGDYSHVEGRGCSTTGDYSHAEGNSSKAEGTSSHAEGVGTTTAKDKHGIDAVGSHAEGIGTITNNESEHAEGHYNISNRKSGTYGNPGNTQHSIGIGSGEYDRKNAIEVMQNGDMYVIGIGDYDGTNPEEATTLQDKISQSVEFQWGNITGTLSDQTDLQSELDSKQETLISGENIKTLNGESIVGEGNIEIKTFRPFPNGEIYGTLEEVVNEILSFPDTSAGVAYLGGISGESTPFGGNAECKVEFMGDGIALLTISSSDTIPYSWQYNTFSEDYVWKKYSDVIPNPDVETDTALSKISIDGQVFKIEGVNDYDELSNKPKIEGITLEGDLTAQDLGLATKNYVDATSENKVDKEIGKGLSTNDFTDADKNKLDTIISNVQSDWSQNDASNQSYIKNKPTIPTKTSDLTNDNSFITQSAISTHDNDASAHQSIRTSISDIESKIPSQASSTNQLADKNFVNSSIENVAAFYITKDAAGNPFSTKAELNSSSIVYSGGQIRVPTRNDYCVVLKDESKTITETGENPTTRYIYGTSSASYSPANWSYQYTVNNSGLTAVQYEAVNSGITISDVEQITTNKNDIDTLNNTKISKPVVQGTQGQILALDASLNPIWKDENEAAQWGSIGGTLSNQTDLQNALDNKENEIPQQNSAPSNPQDGDLWIDTSASAAEIIIPKPTVADAGKFLTVDVSGNYILTTINNANNMTF